MASAIPAGELATTLRHQWRPTGSAYVIVDAAVDYSPIVLLRDQYGKSPRTLFEGEAAAGMAEVAPYVCRVDLGSDFLLNWGSRWGGNHGVLLASAADFDTLHAHLRKIFVVEDDTGQEFFFRYYDPRVLRAYLPTCTADEITAFFGPITSWCVESETADSALVFEAGSEGVRQSEIPLTVAQ